MATLFPFKAEYAKSGRAGCKLCKIPIPKGDLRVAVMVQSRFHDGKDANWFHSDCFFSKQRPKSVGDIEYFENLRYDDQTMIKSKIGAGGADAGASSGSGKRKGKDTGGFVATDFSVGYAKSGRSTCVACEELISKDEVRISKKDYTSETALAYHGGNGMDRWYHVPCFVKVREELEYFVAANKKNLPGFKDLEKEDQTMLLKKLPAIAASKRKLEENGGSNGAGPSKKAKTESKSQKGDPHEEKIRRQNVELYKNRDLAEQLKKPELLQILSTNKQEMPHTPSNVLDLVADIMTFGAMKKCTDCDKGQFMYKSGIGYQCRGYISEFTKCSFVPDGDVERVKFKVPNDLKENPIFADRTFKIQKRIIPKHAAPVAAVAASSSGSQTGPKLNSKPLNGFKFITYGVSEKEDKKLEGLIKKYGGKVTSKMSASVAVAITSNAGFKTSSGTEKAKKYEVPVVSSDFVTNIKEVNYKLAEEISKCLLSDWVKDIRARLKTLNEEFEKPKEEREGKKLASTKLKMKDGAVIDPQSGMDDGPYHVYKEGNLVYNYVLNRISVEDGKNSFYKMQIIESDGNPKSYFVFRSYGRIGTDIGGSQTNEHPTKQDAIDVFCDKFYENTGNVWGSKFVRKPGRYISLDIDYGQKPTEQKAMIPSSETSRLPLPVQALISLIFDVGIMKQTLLEFEIDMDKMPLGKISRKQVLEAYSILTDSLNLREKESDERKYNRLITDITNRFYTLIPHSFGTQAPPLLNNEEVLKAKIDMLDNLMEIEIAFELMSQGDDGAPPSIDSHYKKLNADIDLVEAHSEEFKIIEKYLDNTHAPTHTNYNLEIEQVFKVVRNGENTRYEPFKDLHNRRLLWHGSRVSNFVGIISQGLRIAPPEAPVTGYMFGKGIYFADMVSKSANYCNASRDNTTGLLMLCEVALGDMHELKQAKETLSKAPKNTHSVKGLGETEPDPSETYTFPDGVMVPYGKPSKSKVKNTALLYNEYIVYDIAQVNIKYLLKVNFNYGKRGRR